MATLMRSYISHMMTITRMHPGYFVFELSFRRPSLLLDRNFHEWWHLWGGGHFAPIAAPDLTTEKSYVQYGVSDQLTLATVVIHTSLVGPIFS